MARAAGILAVIFLLFAGTISAQERAIDTTDIYYRAFRNYLKFKENSHNTILLKREPVTTHNIPDTLDGCSIVFVNNISKLKGKQFTIFYVEPARWVDGDFEIRIRQELLVRLKGKKFVVSNWSYFPLKVMWDTGEERYILIPEEEDIIGKLGGEVY